MTGGLRRVTDDMKTKNRVDRPGVVPPSAGKPLILLNPPKFACGFSPKARSAGRLRVPLLLRFSCSLNIHI